MAYEDFEGVLLPLQVRAELERFAERVATLRPNAVLEIGTANGASLFILTRTAGPEAVVVSVDMPGGWYGGGYPAWKRHLYAAFAGPGQRLELLRGNSHDPALLARTRALLGARELDLLYIDGDHTFEGALQDLMMYGPLVRRGGWIVFHDICPHPKHSDVAVDRVWQLVLQLKLGRTEEFIESPAQGWAGIGLLQLDPEIDPSMIPRLVEARGHGVARQTA